MLTIYRYSINSSVNDVNIPIGAKILSVGVATNDINNRDEISLWAEVDNTNPTEVRRFLVFGTGANMDDTINFDKTFIGTIQKSNQYAFHIYELHN